jgi:hypothetical protein
MNPVILKFAHAAGIKSTWEQAISPAEQRFAHLIVQESCRAIQQRAEQLDADLHLVLRDQTGYWPVDATALLNEHFGVGNEQTN